MRFSIAVVATCAIVCLTNASGAAADGVFTGTIKDTSGNPVQGLSVMAMQTSSGSGQSTDPNGRFRIHRPAGSYYLRVRWFGDQLATSETFALADGQTINRDFTVSVSFPNGAFIGRVSDPVGIPSTGARLSLTHTSASGSTSLIYDGGDNGEFNLRMLPEGTYTGTAEQNQLFNWDLDPVPVSFTIADGVVIQQSIDLLPRIPVPVNTPTPNPTKLLATLNAERAASGIPGPVLNHPRWSQHCSAHNKWMKATGNLEHSESGPLATESGEWGGTHAVLAGGSDGRNPWTDAPIHLIQSYTPSLRYSGVDANSSYTCLTTWPGMVAPLVENETITTYPGNGQTGIIGSETASERPGVPGDAVGLPQGTTTGRHLFVFRDSPHRRGPAKVKVLSASLKGPNGALQVRVVDTSNSKFGGYLSGAVIIPVTPLPRLSTFTANVVVDGDSGPISHSWSFTTGSLYSLPRPRLSASPRVLRKAGKVRFTARNLTPGSRYVLRLKMRGKRVRKKSLRASSAGTARARLRISAKTQATLTSSRGRVLARTSVRIKKRR